MGDIAGIVAGLSARGDARNAAAVEHANADRANGRAKVLAERRTTPVDLTHHRSFG